MGDAHKTPAGKKGGTPLIPVIAHKIFPQSRLSFSFSAIHDDNALVTAHYSMFPGHQLIVSSPSGNMPHSVGTGLFEKKGQGYLVRDNTRMTMQSTASSSDART